MNIAVSPKVGRPPRKQPEPVIEERPKEPTGPLGPVLEMLSGRNPLRVITEGLDAEEHEAYGWAR